MAKEDGEARWRGKIRASDSGVVMMEDDAWKVVNKDTDFEEECVVSYTGKN